ncbi:MAG: hypothetical protein AB7G06_06170 [Bdellovibrionales bacterium]
MFDFFNDWRQKREEIKAARESQLRQRQYEQQRRAEYEFEREQKIEQVRVITGDLKHRYVLLESLRAFGHYIAPINDEYDPLEATRRATYHLQAQAVDLGADAIIHARFQVIRYVEQRRGPQGYTLPAYEVHAFGTAVRIVGPPPDWDISETPEQEETAN